MRIELPQLNKNIDIEKDKNLFLALKENDIAIASSCNGDGICGKCVVDVLDGEISKPNDVEKALKNKYQLGPHQRISCQCTVSSDLKITTTYW